MSYYKHFNYMENLKQLDNETSWKYHQDCIINI